MLFPPLSTAPLAIILALLTGIVSAGVRFPSIPMPSPRALKQATRAQIIAWHNRPPSALQRRQEASPLPFPLSQCAGYTSTGRTPYAQFTNLDYNSAVGATNYAGIATREACNKICEDMPSSTYKLAESSCFTVVNFNFYFTATYEVTRKALSCSDPEAVTALAQFPGSSCCTMYRAK